MQTFKGQPYTRKNKRSNGEDDLNFKSDNSGEWKNEGFRTPKTVLKFNRVSAGGEKPLHDTQKPIELIEFLIRSYTNEGETVLDNCMGSGTTAIACLNTNRNFIGFELDTNYFDVANKRIEEVKSCLLNP